MRSLGALEIKGFPEPIEVWTIEGEASSESRFEMVRPRRLTGFIGREREVSLLDERYRLASRGEGQVVLISGEAGIGKSRFAAYFAEHIADEPHTRLRYQCSPYHTATPFHPIIEHLKRAADLDLTDSTERQLDKLEAMIALAAPRVSDVAPLFAAMLSLPSGDRYPPLGLSAAQRRRRTMAALLDQLEGLAREKPVLLLFEDVHWADPSTLEVLDLMIERVREWLLLGLITYRPEFEPPWVGLANVSTLTLNRLDRAQVSAMIDQASMGKKLPDEVAAQIVSKTDGVPLFVEELTKAVLESGVLVEEAERYRLDGLLPPLAIPATLQDSLMARLDRLAPVRLVAQIGAAIGREFHYVLLRAVAGLPENELQTALSRLVASELVFQHGTPPDAVYNFKHALVQDAAHASLLHSSSQRLRS
jgi:predicted ATPase